MENLTVEQAKQILLDNGYIYTFWQKVDIEWRAKDRGINLTPKQLEETKGLIERHFDASIGLNWDVIDIFTDLALERK